MNLYSLVLSQCPTIGKTCELHTHLILSAQWQIRLSNGKPESLESYLLNPASLSCPSLLTMKPPQYEGLCQLGGLAETRGTRLWLIALYKQLKRKDVNERN